jgi:cytochrome c oxidase cbb3-type subunit 4
LDVNTLRGIISILVLITFVAIFFWAYSSKRRKDFDQAANLPFADDNDDNKDQSREKQRDE